MFFPKEMNEIELIVPSKDLLAVTKVLSNYGVFHQTDSNYPGVASALPVPGRNRLRDIQCWNVVFKL